MTTYDNSNLAESYSGATTPLTFSFAREVYAGVYPHFLEMMGVSSRVISANSDLFPNMLAFIGNNMYYNLSEWYRMLALLPGYATNRKFFDRMLGVEEIKGASFSINVQCRTPLLIRLGKRVGLVIQLVMIAVSFLLMGPLTKRFTRRFDSILEDARKTLAKTETYDELTVLFRGTEKRLLAQWRTPIANDFAVMVSTGALAVILEKNGHGNELPELLRSRAHGPLSSLDPGRALMHLALRVSGEKKIVQVLHAGDPALALRTIKNEFHDVDKALHEYIDTYGARSPHELKLESATLSERPEMIVSLLTQLIQHSKIVVTKKTKAREASRGRQGLIAGLLSSWSRVSIARREETRFRRSLIFGFARTIVLSLGKILLAEGLIEHADDIFYLYTDELLRPLEEMRREKDLKDLIRSRRVAHSYWKTRPLPRRIETDNDIDEIERALRENTETPERQSKTLKGTPACYGGGGLIEGKALVLQSFDPDAEFADCILITKHTDPGWTIIFPLLKAIIVERGGMLSHAAIVARELDIPCIVGVPGAVDEFQTGETVSIQIGSGTIAHYEHHEP